MPEPVNPFVPGPGSPGGREAMKHRGWADCDRAWRAWLASDEAVERVARTLYAIQRFGDGSRAATEGALLFQAENGDVRASYLFKARAVLAALRGEDADD